MLKAANIIIDTPAVEQQELAVGRQPESSLDGRGLNFSDYSANEHSPFANALDGASLDRGRPQALKVNLRGSALQALGEIIKHSLKTLERNGGLSPETAQTLRALSDKFESLASHESLSGNPADPSSLFKGLELNRNLKESQQQIRLELGRAQHEINQLNSPIASHSARLLERSFDDLINAVHKQISSIRTARARDVDVSSDPRAALWEGQGPGKR